jgi:RNA polymerase sigma factor (sigma-70 family)
MALPVLPQTERELFVTPSISFKTLEIVYDKLAHTNQNKAASLRLAPRFFPHSAAVKNVITIHKTWSLIIVCIAGIMIAKVSGNTGVKLSSIDFCGIGTNSFWSGVYIVVTKENKTKTSQMPNSTDTTMKVLTEHGDFIRSVIRFYVKDEAEAEDLFQDFFLSLISKPIPKDIRNERAFLYRVISLRVKDVFRKIDRYQQNIHRYAQSYSATIGECPENAVIEADEVEKMFELIQSHLPSREALAITLQYKNYFETPKIAEKMGVKSRCKRRSKSVPPGGRLKIVPL